MAMYQNQNPYNFQPYINPVVAVQQQRLAQMEQMYPQFSQQPMQQTQFGQSVQNGLNGRVVDDISTVNANEIPMDGNIAIFPQRDMKVIHVRRWKNDGTIESTRYEPILDDLGVNPNKLSNDSEKFKIDVSQQLTDLFGERLSTIEDKIDALSKNLAPKTRVKREVDSE